jgi:hypothetical protein
MACACATPSDRRVGYRRSAGGETQHSAPRSGTGRARAGGCRLL